MDAALRSMTLGFEVPRNFNNVESYRPASVDDEMFRAVPNVITAGIVDAIPDQECFDPLLPFAYLKNGRLAEYTVVYFMNVQRNSRISNATRFYRALWLLELFREYICGGGVWAVEQREGALAEPDLEPKPDDEPVPGPSGLQKK